jgi:chromosome transmission fidelity protein 1
VRESKAVYKVAGYWQAQQQRAAAAAAASGATDAPADAAVGTGALHALVGFVQALTNADADGRVVVQLPAADASAVGGGGGGTLRFVLLNAAAHFGRVVSAAHAVVLASGTLSPLESLLHLFPGVPPSRIHRFSCGHVVGRER